jgi:hypothetical protein
MLLVLVACLLNKWQRASSASCLQIKASGLTTPQILKPVFPNSADVIVKIAQLEITQKRKIDSAECVLLVLTQFQ